MEVFYNIVRNEAKKEATIRIDGVIGGFDWEKWEYTNTSKQFVKDFEALEAECDKIHIRINSPGGDIHEGLPIVNAIKRSKCEIHTYNEGIAYSMGSGILFAGHVIHAASSSMVMIHSASTFARGNSANFRKTADVLDKYDDVLSKIISANIEKKKSEVIKEYFDGEDHYFTAEEAFELGLIFQIDDDPKEDPKLENLQGVDVRNYQAVFAAFAPETFPGKKIKGPNSGPQNKSDMSLKNLRALIVASTGSVLINAIQREQFINDLDALEEKGNFLAGAELKELQNKAQENALAAQALENLGKVEAAVRAEGDEGEIDVVERVENLQAELVEAKEKLAKALPGGGGQGAEDDDNDGSGPELSDFEKGIRNEID